MSTKRIAVFLATLFLAATLAWAAGQASAQSSKEPVNQSGKDNRWTVFQIHQQGGWVMWFIDLCLIFGVGITGERFFNLRKSKIISSEFLEEIKRHWYRRDTAAAMQVCKEHDIAISRILRSGLLRFDHGLQDIENAIEGAGVHEATDLRKNLGWLATCASLATMLGLFGTVVGMLMAFGKIEEADTVSPKL
ncbi:MAG: MotA/TolQ/ExbB proton channel family protein, partial [Vicinamibacteria bacterium]